MSFFNCLLLTNSIVEALRIEKGIKYGTINLPPPLLGVKYQTTIAKIENNMSMLRFLENLFRIAKKIGMNNKYMGDIGSVENKKRSTIDLIKYIGFRMEIWAFIS